MSDVKLSVLMITYNHEHFLRQALDSVLSQQVTFPYEIVIGEDCSTDGTRAIVCEYAERFPQLIRPLLPEKNLGMMANFRATLQACRGEYIAPLEGDDFWTSPLKLQKQVDLLDEHQECSACFHNVRITHDGAPEKDRLFHEPPLDKRYFDLKDIVSSHFIPTCSIVYRNRYVDGFPDWFMDMPMGDWPMHVLNAEHGSYAYLDEVMATYRVHDGGVWSGKSRLALLDKTIHACRQIDRYLAGRHPKEINSSLHALTHEFEVEASEIFKAQEEFGRASIRLLRAYLVYPKSRRRVTNCLKSLFAAWWEHCHAADKKVC